MKDLFRVLAISLLAATIGFIVGWDLHKSNVITRAKQFGERETYSYQDMEVVIFGEIQE